MIIIIIVVVLIVYFFVFMRPQATSKIDQHSSKRRSSSFVPSRSSYSEKFEMYYEAGISLLQKLPGYSGDRFELMPFLALVGAVSLESEGKGLGKYQEEINTFLQRKFHIDREFELFDERFKFYYEVSAGAPTHGFWSPSDIPPSILSVPMLRCAVAFGDCITDPERIKDYENAPVLVMDYPDMVSFSKIFTTQFYSFVKTYCTDIVGYDFVPKTLSHR